MGELTVEEKAMLYEGNLFTFLRKSPLLTALEQPTDIHVPSVQPAPEPQVQNEAQDLRGMIETHAQIEELYEETLERQEALSRRFYRKADDATDSVYAGSPHAGMVTLEHGEARPREELRVSDMPRDSFRQLAQIAERHVPDNLPNASRRFILNSCSPEIAEFDDVETELLVLRFRLDQLEQEILNIAPRNAAECVAKLRFMSGLLIDGQEIDQHDFGYILDEMSHVLA